MNKKPVKKSKTTKKSSAYEKKVKEQQAHVHSRYKVWEERESTIKLMTDDELNILANDIVTDLIEKYGLVNSHELMMCISHKVMNNPKMFGEKEEKCSCGSGEGEYKCQGKQSDDWRKGYI